MGHEIGYKKIGNGFFLSAGIILGLTALAKFVSAAGSAPILDKLDPILFLRFRYVFIFAGTLECGVAAVCFFGQSSQIKASVVSWLAGAFLLYRFGVYWVGYHSPCPCLGSLTEVLHIPPAIADLLTKIIIGYLFVGSVATLFSLRSSRMHAAVTRVP